MEATLKHIQRLMQLYRRWWQLIFSPFFFFFLFFASVLTELEIRIRILSPAASRFCPSPSSPSALPAGGGADSAAFPFFQPPWLPLSRSGLMIVILKQRQLSEQKRR